MICDMRVVVSSFLRDYKVFTRLREKKMDKIALLQVVLFGTAIKCEHSSVEVSSFSHSLIIPV